MRLLLPVGKERNILGKSFGIGFLISGSVFVWRKSGKEDSLFLALVNISLLVALIVVWLSVYFFFLREPPFG